MDDFPRKSLLKTGSVEKKNIESNLLILGIKKKKKKEKVFLEENNLFNVTLL